MKKLTILIAMLMAFGGCSKETVEENQLLERNWIKYEINSQKPFTGTSVEFYESGQLSRRYNYKDGERHGLSEGWFENGSISSVVNFKNGNFHGLRQILFPNGNTNTLENWKDDELHGLVLYHRTDGEVYEARYFVDGKELQVNKAKEESGKELTLEELEEYTYIPE
jgi:antitoxin component YwqK of YwqJK toxin-antitoxin module